MIPFGNAAADPAGRFFSGRNHRQHMVIASPAEPPRLGLFDVGNRDQLAIGEAAHLNLRLLVVAHDGGIAAAIGGQYHPVDGRQLTISSDGWGRCGRGHGQQGASHQQADAANVSPEHVYCPNAAIRWDEYCADFCGNKPKSGRRLSLSTTLRLPRNRGRCHRCWRIAGTVLRPARPSARWHRHPPRRRRRASDP